MFFLFLLLLLGILKHLSWLVGQGTMIMTSWLRPPPSIVVLLRPFQRQRQHPRAVLKMMMALVLVAIVAGQVREEEQQVSRLERSRSPTTNSFQPNLPNLLVSPLLKQNLTTGKKKTKKTSQANRKEPYLRRNDLDSIPIQPREDIS